MLPEGKYRMILVVNEDAPGFWKNKCHQTGINYTFNKRVKNQHLSKLLRWYKNTAEIINNYVLPPFIAISGKCLLTDWLKTPPHIPESAFPTP